MVSAKKKKEIAEEIAEYAIDKYGDPTRRKVRPPLDQLIQSALWRYTSVRRGTRALRQLKRTFVDWNEVRVSPPVEIASAMATTDWATTAAEHIKKILESLFDLRNVVSLGFLDELTTAQARTFLRSLQEVPRDLADEVLLFSIDAKTFPINIHTARMAYRLGLVKNPRATQTNQRSLMKLWDKDDYVAVDQLFVDNAREICSESEPRHKKCPVESICPKKGL